MSDLPIELNAAFMPDGSNGSVLVTAGVALTRVGRGERRTLRLVAAAFDPRGRQIGRTAQASADAGLAAVRGDEVVMPVTMALRPGRYEVRVAVDDPAGKVRGSAFTFVDVPDVRGDIVTMSDVVFQPATANPVHGPMHPLLRREFARSEQVIARVRLAQGGTAALESVELSSEVVDTHDRVVNRESRAIAGTDFSPARTADVPLALPLMNLQSGEYLLRLSARLRDHATERVVQFSVRP